MRYVKMTWDLIKYIDEHVEEEENFKESKKPEKKLPKKEKFIPREFMSEEAKMT